MKKLVIFLIAVTFFISCKKSDLSNDTGQAQTGQKTTPNFTSPAYIDPQILQLLAKDLKKDGMEAKANKLLAEYDPKGNFMASATTNETAREYPGRPVSGVGTVMAGGTWLQNTAITSGHIQDIGWVPIQFNDMNSSSAPDAFTSTAPPAGTYLGTVGQHLRLEAYQLPFIQFLAYDIDGNPFTSTVTYFRYRAHVQDIGWMSYVASGNVAGTTGQNKSMEATQIQIGGTRVLTFDDDGGCLCLPTTANLYIYYQAHVEDIGWQGWVSEDQVAGTTGQHRRIEALQIRAYLVKQ
jgi:hypothetical protein